MLKNAGWWVLGLFGCLMLFVLVSCQAEAPQQSTVVRPMDIGPQPDSFQCVAGYAWLHVGGNSNDRTRVEVVCNVWRDGEFRQVSQILPARYAKFFKFTPLWVGEIWDWWARQGPMGQ